MARAHASVKDEGWLRKALSQIMDWDMASPLVDMVAQTRDAHEIGELVTNFAGGDPAAAACIKDYLAWRDGSTSQAAPKTSPASSSATSTTVSAIPVPSEQNWHMHSKGQPSPSKAASSQIIRSSPATDSTNVNSDAEGVRTPIMSEGKILGMFKHGGKIKGPSAASRVAAAAGRLMEVGGASGSGSVLARAAALECTTVNCLTCGKVYDCRRAAAVARESGPATLASLSAAASLDPEVLRFLERGGRCLFCDAQVALTVGDRSQEHASALAAPVGGTETGEEGAAASAAAVAYKDRLIGYEHDSAARTVVIDDQGDFFEVDSNEWLTDRERAEMKQRARLEAEAEAARKRKVSVSIDLIGRKVLVADGGSDVGTSVQTGRDQLLPAAQSPAALAAATLAGAGALSASDEALVVAVSKMSQEDAKEKLHNMRVVMNPSISTPAPQFRRVGSGSSATTSGVPPGGRRSGPATELSSRNPRSTGGGASGRNGRVRAAPGSGRLQSDLGDGDFDQFLEDVTEVPLPYARADRSTYSLCHESFGAGAFKQLGSGAAARHAPDVAPAAAVVAAVPELPPGMVLLKGWLSIDEQLAIIDALQKLGQGAGGFYTPEHSSGASMRLKLMCLGKHWEAFKSEYEDTRSHFDKATPPPIPDLLVGLAQRCLRDATVAAARGGTVLPSMAPDVCLCNFYDPRQGRLGMHQDKDEHPETLRRGLPVVSLSVGDAADFVYSRTRDEADGGVVRLDSGDALVFGGPSRMMFHSVPRIYANTAPQELRERANLRPGRLNLTFRQLGP